MAAYGVPEADIARVVGIDPKTLRKHYRDELDTGAVKATARVAEFLYRKATTEGAQCVGAALAVVVEPLAARLVDDPVSDATSPASRKAVSDNAPWPAARLPVRSMAMARG